MTVKISVYNVGDRVKVKAGKEHDPMSKEKTGVITEIGTPALGIKFDGETKIHKWYDDAEVETIERAKEKNK